MREAPRFQPRSRAAWRAWLARHHRGRTGVWLVLVKKGATRRPNLTAAEAAEEALCFGWIDSLPRRLDASRWMLYVTPRQARSAWSALNKRRVARLVAEGRMAPPGLAAVAAARRNGGWTALDGPHAWTEPPDLAAAFAAAPPAARRHWEGFARSARKGILGWIALARRPETRSARIARTVAMAARNRRAQFDG